MSRGKEVKPAAFSEKWEEKDHIKEIVFHPNEGGKVGAIP